MPGGKKRSYVVKGILTDILKTKSSQKYCSCYEACQLYRAHTDRGTWKKLTIDDKYINKQLFIHQTMFVSDIKKKKNVMTSMTFTPLYNGYFTKFVQK